MKHLSQARFVLGVILAASVFAPSSAWACAACYGASDSLQAKGMNWGIFSLLFVIVSVLGGVASFFIYLVRKSAAINAAGVAAQLPEMSDKAC